MFLNALEYDDAAKSIIKSPSRAEPSRAEPSRAEPSRAEPSRAEPSRAEPSRAEPSPSSCPPGRIVPRLNGCRSGWPPSFLPSAPLGTRSDSLPTDSGSAASASRRLDAAAGAVLAAAVLLTGLLAAGSAYGQTTNTDGSTTLLEGTLTAASLPEVGNGSIGYSRLEDNYGSLSVSPSFTVDSHTYTLARLHIYTASNPKQMEFWLSGTGWGATGAGGDAERKRWVLYWNNQAFPLDVPSADASDQLVEWKSGVPGVAAATRSPSGWCA